MQSRVWNLRSGGSGFLFLFVAPPGSGKGTCIETVFGRVPAVKKLDCGEILRRKVDKFDGARLLSDRKVWSVLQPELRSTLKSFEQNPRLITLDGFPRSAHQSIRIVDWAGRSKLQVVVFSLLVPDEICVDRMFRRGRLGEKTIPDCQKRLSNLKFDLEAALDHLRKKTPQPRFHFEIDGSVSREEVAQEVRLKLQSINLLQTYFPSVVSSTEVA